MTLSPTSLAAVARDVLHAAQAAASARLAAAWATWWEAVDAASGVFLAEDDEQDGAA